MRRSPVVLHVVLAGEKKPGWAASAERKASAAGMRLAGQAPPSLLDGGMTCTDFTNGTDFTDGANG